VKPKPRRYIARNRTAQGLHEWLNLHPEAIHKAQTQAPWVLEGVAIGAVDVTEMEAGK
jgi:hypothetical protein